MECGTGGPRKGNATSSPGRSSQECASSPLMSPHHSGLQPDGSSIVVCNQRKGKSPCFGGGRNETKKALCYAKLILHQSHFISIVHYCTSHTMHTTTAPHHAYHVCYTALHIHYLCYTSCTHYMLYILHYARHIIHTQHMFVGLS